MLHRALASLVVVLGVAALALGIASATLWRPPDTLVAEAMAAPGTTLLMTEPGVLTMADPEVTIRATGDDVVIALGRTTDVEAWLGRDAHTRVTGLADWDVLATQDIAARPDPAEPGTGEPTAPDGGEGIEEPADPPAGEAAEEPGTPEEGEPDGATDEEGDTPETEPVGPDPRGSDLWWAEVSGGASAEMEWAETDGRWSVLVASTGAGAGAPGIALTWPQEVVTPWLLPGVFVGALLIMIGLAGWALILVAQRRQARAIPEPATEAVAEPAAPLTRRQLREAAEAQERRRARPRERDSIVDRFPMLVPAPRPVPTATPAPVPETPADPATVGGRRAVASPEAGEEQKARRRFSLPVRGRRVRSEQEDVPEEQGSPGPQQPPPLAAPGAPAASADAWRRAWGLTESDDDSTDREGDR